MNDELHQEILDRLREQLSQAEHHLYRSVVQACSNPDKHRVVRHRDSRPPWCPLCGRTDRGVKVRGVSTQ